MKPRKDCSRPSVALQPRLSKINPFANGVADVEEIFQIATGIVEGRMTSSSLESFHSPFVSVSRHRRFALSMRAAARAIFFPLRPDTSLGVPGEKNGSFASLRGSLSFLFDPFRRITFPIAPTTEGQSPKPSERIVESRSRNDCEHHASAEDFRIRAPDVPFTP